MFVNLMLKDLIVENKFNVINLIEKIEVAKKLGIKRLVIAPYYYDEESKSSIDEVKEKVEDLNLYLAENNSDIKLYAGNIVRDNYDNVRDFINGKIGSVNDSKYVLINPEESSDIKELLDILYEFTLRGYIPIIVAPEKVEEIIDDYKNINILINEGCLFQLDAVSLSGEYGKKISRTANILRKKGAYSFVGFEDDIRKNCINKDIESISKKGLVILTKNGEINNKINIRNKKVGSSIKFWK